MKQNLQGNYNLKPGQGMSWRTLITHCPRNHRYSIENTYIRLEPYSRICRACRREKAREIKSNDIG